MESPKTAVLKQGIKLGNTMVSLGCLLSIIIPVCIIVGCLVFGLFLNNPTLTTTDDYMREYGGSADVYNKILSSNDCAFLQKQFDQADSNLKLHDAGSPFYRMGEGYMKAADNRMNQLNCYGSSDSVPTVSQVSTNVIMQITFAESSATSYILPTLTQPATQISLETSEPTATFIFKVPTAPASGSVSSACSCTRDTLNCSDFSTQSEAQDCLNYCVIHNPGTANINRLDGDNDGLACEGLP
jgi:hypothetical protein